MKNTSPLSFMLLLLFVSFKTHSSPSFNCANAQSIIEKSICLEENIDIQDMDRQLAKLYKKGLKSPQKKLLKESQRKWIKFRDEQCNTEAIYNVNSCLRKQYSSRINELENKLITIPIKTQQLPYTFAINNSKKGTLTYNTTPKVDNGDGGIQQKTSLDLTTNNNTVTLWSATNEYYGASRIESGLEWVKIHIYEGQHYIIEINYFNSGSAATSSSIYHTNVSDYIVLSSLSPLHQGSIIKSGGGHHRTTTSTNWHTKKHLQLQVTSHNKKYNDYTYLHPVSFSEFNLNLTGPTWLEKHNELKTNIDLNKQLSIYKNINNQIDSALIFDSNAAKYPTKMPPCVENGIDWTEVAKGLHHWLSFAQKYQYEIHREQILYSLPALLSQMEELTLTKTQRALAVGLDFYRQKIESTPQWEEKLTKIGVNNIQIETMMQSGFPTIETQCSHNIIIGNFDYLNFNRWLYTFWLRRYKDGSYEIAKKIVKHYAK